MGKEQEMEWSKAQKIVISEDLVATARKQLKFLAAVDRNRWLYKGPAVKRSIYRYFYVNCFEFIKIVTIYFCKVLITKCSMYSLACWFMVLRMMNVKLSEGMEWGLN